ncbi:MAG: acyl carrier protein [Flavitalea sp.]
MDKAGILKTINGIFTDVLDNDDIVLTDKTTAADVQDWDSLNHIQLIVAIEKKFKIKFSTTDIHQFKNVGDLVDAVEKKLS